jgi:hypothetical protein
MSRLFKLLIYSLLYLFIVGCERENDLNANLTVKNVDFVETYINVVLDLPNGTFVPDNPNFDLNNPNTWTGNMAQYVNHNFIYSVSYSIKNIGHNIAYNTEVDLHFIFDNGTESIETIYIGKIKPNETINKSSSVGCTNKQLSMCSAEAFWLD